MIVKVDYSGVAMNAHVVRSMGILKLLLSAMDEVDLWMCDGDLSCLSGSILMDEMEYQSQL
jgi:hypothetical protein